MYMVHPQHHHSGMVETDIATVIHMHVMIPIKTVGQPFVKFMF